jgi:hypothetical protein
MTIKIDDTTVSLITNLATATGHKIGDGEMPVPLPTPEEPYAIVYTIPGGSTYGSMAAELENATILYQIKIVGHTNSQCRKFQQKIEADLETIWRNISGCMGPARMVIGGIVKEDERTFVANDTLYMEITQ